MPSTGSAAIEYTAVARGAKDFALYYRLEPWDHAAGALLITEAGGCIEHLDGSAYSAASPWQTTFLASSPALCAQLRGHLTRSDGGRHR
jgi:fructose-1,6-bisphosphatase/inositol monophosphatase family enzyme